MIIFYGYIGIWIHGMRSYYFNNINKNILPFLMMYENNLIFIPSNYSDNILINRLLEINLYSCFVVRSRI